ncbi:hypothetical protein Tco_0804103 [Tanacetum coccineum]|uniref:Uncharacterized protein n=1 Tax=Tanacetum coccineum TaxID=301880 RepID=A0ABQ5A7M9_9ASTR
MVFCIHTDFTNWPEITEEELVRLQSSIISVRYCAPRSAPSVGGDEYSGFPSGEGRGIQHGSLNLPINCAPLVIYVQRPEPLSSSISQWHCIGTAKISNIEVKLPPLGNLIPRSICSALLTIPVEQGWYRFPSAPGACRENCRGNEAPTPRCRIVWKDAELKNENRAALESTAGRTMELVLEQPEVDSTDVLAPTPLRSVPSVTVDPPRPDATSIGSSEDADVAEGISGTSTEEETPGASPTLAAKEVTETPPPKNEYESLFDPLIPDLEDTADLQDTGIFGSAYDDEYVGAEAALSNLETNMSVSPIPTTRIHKYHPKAQIIGEMEPKKVTQALDDERWVEAMQEELLQFKLLNV